MPAKNNHEFSHAGVLARIKEEPGVLHVCNQFAKSFGVTSDQMRRVLMDLVRERKIESGVQGKNRVYYVHSDAEREALESLTVAHHPKEYVQSGPAWSMVYDRLAEFREIPSIY